MNDIGLRPDDMRTVEGLLEEIDPLYESFYLAGSSVNRDDYEDVDVVIETGGIEEALNTVEGYEELSVERSFGQIESRSTDKWIVQGEIKGTDFDIILHRTPYSQALYSSEHLKLR